MERRSEILTLTVVALLALPLACRTQPRVEPEVTQTSALAEQQPGGGTTAPAPAAAAPAAGATAQPPRPAPAASSFACGDATCGPDQFCVRHVPICIPWPANKPCPPGATRTTCGESLASGCIRPPCDQVAPRCADLPAICGDKPSCGCANDICAPRPCTAFSMERREFTCVCP
jgi:hypothetical protein